MRRSRCRWRGLPVLPRAGLRRHRDLQLGPVRHVQCRGNDRRPGGSGHELASLDHEPGASRSAFNVVKGSVPARTDVSDEPFDACGKQGMAEFAEAAANRWQPLRVHGPMVMPTVPAVKNAFYDVITAHFNGEYDAVTAASEMSSGRRHLDRAVNPDASADHVGPSDHRGPYIPPAETCTRPQTRRRGADYGPQPVPHTDLRTRLQHWMPETCALRHRFALVIFLFVYGFIAFTIYLSPSPIAGSCRPIGWVGFENYEKLFRLRHWDIAVSRTWWSSLRCYIAICTVIGLMLAILLDQKIRGEGVLQADLPLPDGAELHRDRARPGNGCWTRASGLRTHHAPLGVGKLRASTGSRTATYAIYTVVHGGGLADRAGFVMAMFLAGLRGIDNEILKAAQMDGASNFAALSPDHHPAAAARPSCPPS